MKRCQVHFGVHAVSMVVVWTFCAWLLMGCQLQPTKIKQTESRDFDVVVSKSTKPLVLNESTVVLDVRSAFDYGLSRVQGSQHFPYEKLTDSSASGALMPDRRKLAQRLALMGLSIDTPIVVVGYGNKGRGEEGRLAWTLLYLGFRDVQTASVEMFRNNLTQRISEPPRNATPVEIEPQMNLIVPKEDFKRLAQNTQERTANHVWILDVQDEKNLSGKKSEAKIPDVGALKVEWNQFYTAHGRPDPSVRKKLNAAGIRPEDRILVVGATESPSSAASYALISLGYGRVENFLSGWRGY